MYVKVCIDDFVRRLTILRCFTGLLFFFMFMANYDIYGLRIQLKYYRFVEYLIPLFYNFES